MFRVEARLRVRMQNMDLRQQDTQALQKTLPGPTAPLTAPSKLTQPESQHVLPERFQFRLVTRNRIVLEIPPHHRLQPFCRTGNRLVHPLSQLPLDICQLGCHALADGRSHYSEIARLPAPPTNVSETQK